MKSSDGLPTKLAEPKRPETSSSGPHILERGLGPFASQIFFLQIPLLRYNKNQMKNKFLYWFTKILTILIGGFFMIFGEFDDSPGLQGIGLIFILVTIFTIIKNIKKK